VSKNQGQAPTIALAAVTLVIPPHHLANTLGYPVGAPDYLVIALMASVLGTGRTRRRERHGAHTPLPPDLAAQVVRRPQTRSRPSSGILCFLELLETTRESRANTSVAGQADRTGKRFDDRNW
jgi:hypothetical protein